MTHSLYSVPYLIGFTIFITLTAMTCNTETEQAKPAVNISSNTEKEIIMDTFGIDYLMGKFDPSKHPDFTVIEDKYADRSNMFMRKKAYEAFQRMYEAAKGDGIKLVIRSAARNFNYQKGIWERKWTGQTTLSDGTNLGKSSLTDTAKALKILEYSSMPGTSRHHWGTDIDFNSFNNKWFESGEGLKLYNWLTEHAHTFGFFQVYTAFDDERSTGYQEEKWHWSYKPLSSLMTKEAALYLKNQDIQGFLGSNTAQDIDVVKNYILGIHPNCTH